MSSEGVFNSTIVRSFVSEPKAVQTSKFVAFVPKKKDEGYSSFERKEKSKAILKQEKQERLVKNKELEKDKDEDFSDCSSKKDVMKKLGRKRQHEVDKIWRQIQLGKR
jgi:intein/homing endonuclease